MAHPTRRTEIPLLRENRPRAKNLPQTVPSHLLAIICSLINRYLFRCRNALMRVRGAPNRSHARLTEHLKSFTAPNFLFDRALLEVLLGLMLLIF